MAVVLINTVRFLHPLDGSFLFLVWSAEVIESGWKSNNCFKEIKTFSNYEFQEATENENNFSNIFVWQKLEMPNAERVKQIEEFLDAGMTANSSLF